MLETLSCSNDGTNSSFIHARWGSATTGAQTAVGKTLLKYNIMEIDFFIF